MEVARLTDQPIAGRRSPAGDPPGVSRRDGDDVLRVATGVAELDDYLGGGLPAGSIVLAIGAPFDGKDALAAQFLASGLSEADAFITILTGGDTGTWRRRLQLLNPNYAALERAGIAHYINLFGSMDERTSEPFTTYLAPPVTGSRAVAAVETEIAAARDMPIRRLVMPNFSTWAALNADEASLRMFMQLVGALRRSGVTAILTTNATPDMAAATQGLKTQVDGVIEMREQGGETQVRLQGLGLAQTSPWVAYSMEEGRMVVTGSWNIVRLAD